MITIKEMADMIGVSPTTISNVIHGKTKEVSQSTVEKVTQILHENNYIPNMNARNLAKKDSMIIGVVVKYRMHIDKNFMQDPFASELLGAIETKIRNNNYYTMIYLSEELEEILRFVSTWNVDGLISVGFWPDECEAMKNTISKPMVFIDSYLNNDGHDYINVGLEDKMGGYEITKYLTENGHRNIAFITDNMTGVYRARYDGFQAALQEVGVKDTEDNILTLRPNKNEFEGSLQNVYKRMNEFTALFCVSDYYAMRIMNYLMDRGVKIPENISITGFDDNMIGQSIRPALTTMRQNPTQKGYIAVEQLIKAIEGNEVTEKNILLTTELIIRNTVKKIN